MIRDKILAKDVLPEFLVRFGIRTLLRKRLNDEFEPEEERRQENFMKLIRKLKDSPIAVNTFDANEQHYEVPTEFFQLVLGRNLKYSCGFWDDSTLSLEESEEKMLDLTCERADLKDGDNILELGCGWGSLTLYMAQKFPNSKVTAVSNSKTQKEYIDKTAAARNLKNINVITEDINSFHSNEKFDKIVSVEMFEHMRNYELLFLKINEFLKPGGEIFIHIFAHNKYAYLFEVKDESDWMSKYFFTGGIMPSDHLLLYFAKGFEVKNHWIVNGTNYEKTSNAWLANMELNKKKIMIIFADTYGKEDALKWFSYWKIFFMACAELWGFNGGNEWFVSHYLLKKGER